MMLCLRRLPWLMAFVAALLAVAAPAPLAAQQPPANTDTDAEFAARAASIETTLMQNRDAAARLAAVSAAANLPVAYAVPLLVVALGDVSDGVRQSALERLRELGPAAVSAFDAVAARITTDGSVSLRVLAVQTLAAISSNSPATIAALYATLDRPDGRVRDAAFEILQSAGEAVESLTPAILAEFAAVIERNDGARAGEIIGDVCQLPFTHATRKSVLLTALNSPCTDAVRIAAFGMTSEEWRAEWPAVAAAFFNLLEKPGAAFGDFETALYAIFPLPDSLLPRLLHLLAAATEPDADIGWFDDDIAAMIAAVGARMVPLIVAALEAHGTTDSEFGFQLLEAISQMGPAAAPAIPFLTRIVIGEMPGNRAHAAFLIVNTKAPAVAQIPVLSPLLADADMGRYVGEILGHSGAPALPPLRAAFAADSSVSRENAAWGFATLGPLAAAVVPDLLAASTANTPVAVRVAIVRALGEIRADRETVLPHLLGLVGDEKAPELVRAAAIRAVGGFGEMPGAAAESMIAVAFALVDGSADRTAREDALRGLAGIAPTDPRTIAKLWKLFAEPDFDLAHVAFELLEELGPRAASLVPQLLARLQPSDEWFARVGELKLLMAIAPDHPDVVAAIYAVANEEVASFEREIAREFMAARNLPANENR